MSISKTVALLLLVTPSWVLASEPLSKSDLLELVQKEVSEELILRLVERDCVDFEVDASSLVELSGQIPEAILETAIACREYRDSLESADTPPGTSPDAEDISLGTSPPLTLAFSWI